MRKQLEQTYQDIISVENLLAAWQEFIRGKRNKSDVQLFASSLIDNILQLHEDLVHKTYKHGGYYNFNISDPKPRNISKASVRDRLVHHAVYRILYPFFAKIFVADSYSCRINKGTHRAINRFQQMFRKVSQNNTRTCWVLKLDIKKFFANIDHEVLIQILKEYIPDQNIMWLLEEIIDNFEVDCFVAAAPRNDKRYIVFASEAKQSQTKGLPLGNLTSQLFVNVYMNEFDQFVKHKLKAKYYIRYSDDFVILSLDKNKLIDQLTTIQAFLEKKLHLILHPNKIILKTFSSGVDFLGWVNFPNHRVLRSSTKRRMLRRIHGDPKPEILQSYFGLLSYGSTFKLQQEVINSDKISKPWL